MDHTRRFGDVAAAITKLSAHRLVRDGEVAIYDQQLRSRFDWLREPDPDAVAFADALRGVRPALLRPPRPGRAAAT